MFDGRVNIRVNLLPATITIPLSSLLTLDEGSIGGGGGSGTTEMQLYKGTKDTQLFCI